MEKLLEKRYSEYLINPKVFIEVFTYKPIRILLKGEVRSPGLIKFPAYSSSSFSTILNKLDHDTDAMDTNSLDIENKENQIKALQNRIDRLEKLLLDTKANTGTIDDVKLQQARTEYQNDKIEEMSKLIVAEINVLNKKIENNSDKIDGIDQQSKINVAATVAPKDEIEVVEPLPNEVDFENVDEESTMEDSELEDKPESFTYLNTSAFVGANFGGATTGNLGVRLHYAITNSSLIFMPEAFIGFGGTTSFGGSANIIYPIKLNSEKIF
mgnify:CR=1 FL=1